MTKRYDELVAAAMKEHSVGAEPLFSDLVHAFAAMLDKALPPSTRRKRTAKDDSSLAFSPGELHQALLQHCHPEHVLCEPYNSSDFGLLGRNLKKLQGLQRQDMTRLVDWFLNGGTKSWTVKPTFAHVAKGVSKYITWAREQERTGSQSITDFDAGDFG